MWQTEISSSRPSKDSTTSQGPGNNGSKQQQQNDSHAVSGSSPPQKADEGSHVSTHAVAPGQGGGSHRSISPEFSVNPVNGTMSMSLPIYTSPGRSDFGPKLALSYDSGNGNGPFGVGWQLSTLSISRKTSKGIPKYDEADVFVLSSCEDLVPAMEGESLLERIIESGYGKYRVKRYRPRVETEVNRIECWTLIENADDVHWRVISGDNQTTFFGETDESRIVDLGSDGLPKRIFSWLASRTVDSAGNAVYFQYKAENSQGIDLLEAAEAVCEINRSAESRSRMRYLKRIFYGNRIPCRDLETWKITDCRHAVKDLDCMFEVVFDYGDHDQTTPTSEEQKEWNMRENPFSARISGFELRTYRLCQRILMFHRFPKAIGRNSALVSSTGFDYTHSSGVTLLKSFQVTGYLPCEEGTEKDYSEILPPVEFEYTRAPDHLALEIKEVPRDTLAQISGGSSKWQTQWVDLDGEGAPGTLLTIENGAWWYQRNEMLKGSSSEAHVDSDSFGPLKQLPFHPSNKDHYFEDLTHSGRMNVVCHGPNGSAPQGYFERTEDSQWDSFKPFISVPQIPFENRRTKRIDLTGDGLQDILHQEQSGELVWYQCLGKTGFAPGRKVASSLDPPRLISHDPATEIYLADMTGDGLADIVVAQPGNISYWPNLGHGQFGSRVSMGRSPVLDRNDQFTHDRVRLADICGSGTTDLIYLPAEGGIHVYFNLAGNCWSERIVIPNFPAIDNTASVFTLDLLGNGTSCLCWSGTVASGKSSSTLRYVELNGGIKPNLMSSCVNGMGTTTSISYQSSTKYYLDDEQNGVPWSTRLPFPVQCVSKVVVHDQIAQTLKKTRYAYHDGHFDGVEREFRGFGIVEHWDDEQFGNADSAYLQRPSIRTQEWYHTGAMSYVSKDDGLYDSNISPHRFPETLAVDEHYDIHRALKGHKLREELYSEDGSKLASIPYLVCKSSYQVQRIQATTQTELGVYRVDPLESVKAVYERQITNPKIERDMVLKVNIYGDVLKSLKVTHGMKKSTLSDPADNRRREASWGMFVENTFTDPFDEIDSCFRKPQLASMRQFAVACLSDSSIADIDMLAAHDCAFFQSMDEIPYNELDTHTASSPCKSLVQETRTYYLDALLRGPLPLGRSEAFSIPDRTYQLVFDKGFLHENLLLPGHIDERELIKSLELGGYECLDADDRWWKPSEKHQFSTDPSQNLQRARQSFYCPTITVDCFGATYTNVLDCDNYLVTETIDPMGNISRFKNDYWHLQPVEVTDMNGNRTQTAFDAFGSPVGVARLGKEHENVGDSLDGFAASVSDEDLEAFLQDPTGPLSRSLLGNAGQRVLMYPGRFNTQKALGRMVPGFTAEITCDSHYRERTANSNILISITYLDGHGAPLQTTTLCKAASATSKEQWRISEWLIKDSKGNPVRICQPSFAGDHHFRFEANIDSPKTTKLLDPLDRVVGILNADHTWSKVRVTPWSKVEQDPGGTLKIEDPALDEDVGHFFQSLPQSEYLPTWLQHPDRLNQPDIARKCEVYADKQSIAHLDARGYVFLDEVVLGDGKVLRSRKGYNIAGHIVSQYDYLQRLVQQQRHDMLGRPMVTKTMDSTDKIVLLDCMDKPLLNWDQPSTRFRHVYDVLRREREMWMKDSGDDGKNNEILLHRIRYDSLDRPGFEDNNLKGKISCIEDQSGRLESIRFDFKGNCVEQKYKMANDYKSILDWRQSVILDLPEYACISKFNALNQEVESIDPIGCVTIRIYDLAGNLRSVTTQTQVDGEPNQLVSDMTYSADNLVLTVVYGNKTELHNLYDKQSRRKMQATLFRSDSSREKIQDIHYNYDCMGRILQKWDTAQPAQFFRNCKIDPEWTYTYDNLGRLVEATGREQVETREGGGFQVRPHQPQRIAGLGEAMCQYREVYRYDDVGNVLSMHHDVPNLTSVSGWTRRYEYTEESNLQPGVLGNRLSQTTIGGKCERYEYGETPAGRRGCMTSMAGYSNLAWDHMSQLRSSSRQKAQHGTPERTWYVYNLTGFRVRKITERARTPETTARSQPSKCKESIFLPGVDIYRKFAGNGMTVTLERTQNHVAATCPIAIIERKSGSSSQLTRYQAGDNLELDSQSRFISSEEYSPFGSTVNFFKRRKKGGQAPRKYRFAAYERDRETGLYYCHHRYYAPWLGRWTSLDPLGIADGFNLYQYVHNDPVNGYDPSGTVKKTVSAEKTQDVESLDETSFEKQVKTLKDNNKRLEELIDEPTATERETSTKRIFTEGKNQQVDALVVETNRKATNATASGYLKGHRHHLLGQQYKPFWMAAGLNTDQLTVHLTVTTHMSSGKQMDAYWGKFWFKEAEEFYKSKNGTVAPENVVTQFVEHINGHKKEFQDKIIEELPKAAAKGGFTLEQVEKVLAEYKSQTADRETMWDNSGSLGKLFTQIELDAAVKAGLDDVQKFLDGLKGLLSGSTLLGSVETLKNSLPGMQKFNFHN